MIHVLVAFELLKFLRSIFMLLIISCPSGTKTEAKVVEEKTEFNVIIKDVPTAKRITVIKVVRSLTSLGLKEAKDLIESVPKQVLDNVSKEKADESKKLLEEAGAVVVIE